ncbi:MAG: permease-like cell division protein FtsX [Clostridia bacterium]|nr:permease-like cell division protein FtsX [Clostridia bacterium]
MEMKIRTAKYMLKEGVVNVYRNKPMTLASVSIITASLLILGIFILITINLSKGTGVLNNRPEMEVFCQPELDETEVAKIQEEISKDPDIKEFKKVTKVEAMERFKAMLEDKQGILEGLDDSFLPISFIIKLKDPSASDRVTDKYKKNVGIRKVSYPKKELDFFSRISYWVNLVSGFLIIVLLIISTFIIANTIKLTVFARRKEINIMKYIGATDWFIRWPFVVEGIVIGLIGAVIALIFTAYGYNAIGSRINSDFVIGDGVTRLIGFKAIGGYIIGIYCLVGGFVGALGSFISMRKYLHV